MFHLNAYQSYAFVSDLRAIRAQVSAYRERYSASPALRLVTNGTLWLVMNVHSRTNHVIKTQHVLK